MAEKGTENKISLTEAQIKDLQSAFEKGSFSDYSEQLKGTLRSLEDVRLEVGVTGEPGVGKSTFVNAFRDLRPDDEGAAPTGGSGADREPRAYPHPKYADVVLWDLPSIGGGPDFHPREYLQRMNASRCDFFLILSSGGFASVHAKLAQHLRKIGKDFYFVRSKVDRDLEAGRREQAPGSGEAEALRRIREGCLADLEASGVRSPKLFLISNLSFGKFDFPLLGETLWKDLELPKSHSFLLAAPNVSHRLLEKKKAAILRHLWLVALVACGVRPEPLPEISVACDAELLANTLRGYCVHFGLEEASLRAAAGHAGLPLEPLKALVKSPLAAEITRELVTELLVEAAGRAPKLPKELVPVAAVGLSFAVVYNMLKAFVEEAAADAHRILLRVFMSQKPREESRADLPGASEEEDGGLGRREGSSVSQMEPKP